LSAKFVPNFVGRWCHVVSVTDPFGSILGFLDRHCEGLWSVSGSHVKGTDETPTVTSHLPLPGSLLVMLNLCFIKWTGEKEIYCVLYPNIHHYQSVYWQIVDINTVESVEIFLS
jgi:hypothetical protein